MVYRSLAIEYLEKKYLFGKVKSCENDKFDGEKAVLAFIFRKSIVTPKEISETLCLTSARVAAVLNGLQDDGLITRHIDQNDRRQIVVELTKKGNDLAQVHLESFIDRMTTIFSELGEHDAKEYVRLMSRVVEITRQIVCSNDNKNK